MDAAVQPVDAAPARNGDIIRIGGASGRNGSLCGDMVYGVAVDFISPDIQSVYIQFKGFDRLVAPDVAYFEADIGSVSVERQVFGHGAGGEYECYGRVFIADRVAVEEELLRCA